MIFSCPSSLETPYVCFGVGLGVRAEGGNALGAAQKLAAESLCQEKPKGLLHYDLVNGMGSLLCLHGLGGHRCN